MYFEIVLSYLATLFKWHLFNELLESPHGSSLYIFACSSLFLPGLNLPGFSFKSSAFQSFCYCLTTPLFSFPLFGIAKVEIFLISAKFIFKFFVRFRTASTIFPSILSLSNQPLFSVPPVPSEPGCKGRNLIGIRKIYFKIFGGSFISHIHLHFHSTFTLSIPLCTDSLISPSFRSGMQK